MKYRLPAFNGKTYIAFSGGVESSAMCLLFGNEAEAIFADTGFEHQAIYDRIDMLEVEIKKIHPNFKIHRIKNEKHGSLKDYILKQKFYPSPKARYCTGEFKIKPIDKFLKGDEKVRLLIGLNADEKHRTGNHGLVKNVYYEYPLIMNDITREDCLFHLGMYNLEPNFPPYMKRGGCVGCFYKSKKEYVAMALLNPDEFKVVEDLENAIQDRRESFYSIRQDMTMKQIREHAENILFSKEEMYDIYLNHDMNMNKSCGVFCNR